MVEKITALMTTIPIREEVVLITLDSIYDQVDEIRIVFNGYDRVPSWASKVPKIISYLDSSNQFTDCAKWQYLPEEGYVFVIDDDIQYPPNYVSTMICKIEQYKRKAVMTVHGSVFKRPFVSFGESKRAFHFEKALSRDIRVAMIANCTLSFHLETVRPEFKDFLAPSRTDIWFSAVCLKKQIPMICVGHRAGWLKSLKTKGQTIWELSKTNKEFGDKNTEYIKENIIPYLTPDIFFAR